ncbi:biotin synthase BioB [Macrococcus equipercicus]|uniref:Biotin synthase n=1 Tax=Macrococcus equipercicus TaxID=69967 RepID=A0A9Q9BRK2_9STAP|nr:biotin synthase BioB [Macrococcus equipercicus]UTH14401.1 biotin synthase BioB [Macrococcus equipercicus]
MTLGQRVIDGYVLTKEEALNILHTEDKELLTLINEAYHVRYHYYQNKVKLNMILNAKSGLCAEDCGYCGQSVKANTGCSQYALVDEQQLVEGAGAAVEHQIGTYCIVMSGRKPTNREVGRVTNAVETIKQKYPTLKICACLGLTNDEQAKKLKAAGVDRYNHNINTSERYHDKVVTTHSYQDRVNTIEIMKNNHISPCSGVICGMGETADDIVNMAFALKEINADSIPVNFLHAIKGTKFEDKDDLTPNKCLKILALFRLVNPTKEIRVSGGREVNLRSLQPLSLYMANSIFVGDYLVTNGQPNEEDYQMIQDLGFEIETNAFTNDPSLIES